MGACASAKHSWGDDNAAVQTAHRQGLHAEKSMLIVPTLGQEYSRKSMVSAVDG